MIVKIQKPLVTNAKNPEYLVYNQSRTVQLQIPGLDELFTGGELRIYHKARLKGDQLIIKERVNDQLW